MKYTLLFLLMFFSSYSQTKPADLTSVEIFKCYSCGGPGCTDGGRFAINNPQFVCTYNIIRYFSKDHQTVQNLYVLYLNGKNWKKKVKRKDLSYFGDGNIQHMIVISYNSFKDTIYTTKENKSFFYKDGDYEYFDPQNNIVNAFELPAKKFFKKDFLPEIKKLEDLKNDSIDVNTVKLDGKKIYGLTKDQFEREIDTINKIVASSEKFSRQDWEHYSSQYFQFENAIGFNDKSHTIGYISIKVGEKKVSIADISFGINDSYEEISAYFKTSAKKVNLEKELYNRKDNTEEDYTKRMKIDFFDDEGYLLLTFKNNKLGEIEIIYGSQKYR